MPLQVPEVDYWSGTRFLLNTISLNQSTKRGSSYPLIYRFS